MDSSYLELYRTGELQRRVNILEARLKSCDICPRECHVNRLQNEYGFCHSGYLPVISAVCDHHGEEPAISGTRGTGAIFFGNCNMRCVYCQNSRISQDPEHQISKEVQISTLADHMMYLQDKLSCHSISFISPSHFVAQLVKAVMEAIPRGLHIPLIYNTNAYDSISTLQLLEGVIDVYLPDLKYASDVFAKRFSNTPNYVVHSHNAIREMYRQVGDRLILDEMGLVQKGLIIRHLILPNRIAGSRKTLSWIARQISPDITMSVMAQYYPTHLAGQISQLCRKISESEYMEVLALLDELNITNGWIQEMDAADTYKPHFEELEHPFH